MAYWDTEREHRHVQDLAHSLRDQINEMRRQLDQNNRYYPPAPYNPGPAPRTPTYNPPPAPRYQSSASSSYNPPPPRPRSYHSPPPPPVAPPVSHPEWDCSCCKGSPDENDSRSAKPNPSDSIRLPCVIYPIAPPYAMMLRTFPLDKESILDRLPKGVLLDFVEDNNIDFVPNNGKELLFYKIKEFLEEKRRIHGLGHVAISPWDGITEDMLSKLTLEAAATLQKMRSETNAKIRHVLSSYGVTQCSGLNKRQLLKAYFNVLFENSEAETDIQSRTKKSAKPSSTSGLRNECCICWSRQLKFCIIPCGHVALCDLCSTKVTQCPICRGPVKKLIAVFFA